MGNEPNIRDAGYGVRSHLVSVEGLAAHASDQNP